MSRYKTLQNDLEASPKRWLVTGVGGFIGSNLLEALLKMGQTVRGLDSFVTGHRQNLDEVRRLVSPAQWARFEMIEGDIRDAEVCRRSCRDLDFVLHQAALGSVPRSIEDPISTHQSNVDGFINMLWAAREADVRSFVYASSSAVYGDHPGLPKIEDSIGSPLSPYAATKLINEVYARSFAKAYGFPSVGLRYFNVFGPRQDPEGAYAAVIPKWVAALLRGETVYINGDGETSRDFCFVANVVQANLLAATGSIESKDQVYNIALGDRTTLNELFSLVQGALRKQVPSLPEQKPVYREFRAGDVRHSLANISKAQNLLGYSPTHKIDQGLELAMKWYCDNVRKPAATTAS